MDENDAQNDEPVFTIGYGNLPWDAFMALLARFGIELLVDVRSQPYSTRLEFTKDALFRVFGPGYLHEPRLGGLGRPDPDRMRDGARCLLDHHGDRKIALMCAEADPRACHRHILLFAVFAAEGRPLVHILHDGTLWRPRHVQMRLDGDGSAPAGGPTPI